MVCVAQVYGEMRNWRGNAVDCLHCFLSASDFLEDKHIASRRQHNTKKLLLPARMMDFVIDEVEAVQFAPRHLWMVWGMWVINLLMLHATARNPKNALPLKYSLPTQYLRTIIIQKKQTNWCQKPYRNPATTKRIARKYYTTLRNLHLWAEMNVVIHKKTIITIYNISSSRIIAAPPNNNYADNLLLLT